MPRHDRVWTFELASPASAVAIERLPVIQTWLLAVQARLHLLNGNLAEESAAPSSRFSLWPILFSLSQLDANPTITEQLHRQARKIVEYISEHIPMPELQASFVNLLPVRTVLDRPDP